MTLIGKRQVPLGIDPSVASSLGLYITDKNGQEILDNTKIRIAKIKPSEDVVIYSDVKMRNGKTVYSFTNGVEPNGDVRLMIFAVDSRCNIPDKNVKFKIETDIWTRNV